MIQGKAWFNGSPDDPVVYVRALVRSAPCPGCKEQVELVPAHRWENGKVTPGIYCTCGTIFVLAQDEVTATAVRELVAKKLTTPPPVTRVRWSDPPTSFEAALSATPKIRESQMSVLRALSRPGIDEDIYARLDTQQSRSGARTRRSELVKAGLVVDSGEKGRTRSGRRSIVWRKVHGLILEKGQ